MAFEKLFRNTLINEYSATFDSYETDNLMVRCGRYYKKHSLFAMFEIHTLKIYFSA